MIFLKTLTRKCLVCGKELKIKLNRDRTYTGGYYFGEIKLPIGKGKWKKVGETDTLKPVQDRTDVVKWSGREKGIEYWECDRCYNKMINGKMRTFHMKHDEEMNFNCKECDVKISAHNKDWHDSLCDDCFNKKYFPE